MARPFSPLSLLLLMALAENKQSAFHSILTSHGKAEKAAKAKSALYRLESNGLVTKAGQTYHITPEGRQVIHKTNPKKDGIWKIILFDIPEKKRPVRNYLRQKLESLGFKKWQNSVWVSPYYLDQDIEQELLVLARSHFVRLIKTKDINYDKDLQKLFPE